MYLLVEQRPPGPWQWTLLSEEHRPLSTGEPCAQRVECLASAAEHLGGEIEIPVVERNLRPLVPRPRAN
jgi:hypothetical protein